MAKALATKHYVARAFERAYGVPWSDALKLALGRLGEHGVDGVIAGSDDTAHIALPEGVDGEGAYLLTTRRAFELDGQHVLLPFVRGDVGSTVAIEWRGSIAASSLVSTVEVGEKREHVLDFAKVRRIDGKRVMFEPLVPCRVQGRAVKRSVEVVYPTALVANGELHVVFGDLTELFDFMRDPETKLWSGYAASGWVLAAMDVAFQRGQCFSLMNVEGVPESVRASLPPTTLERTTSFALGKLCIATVGEADALVVHSDQLRQHFGDVKLTEALSRPEEPPNSVHSRASV